MEQRTRNYTFLIKYYLCRVMSESNKKFKGQTKSYVRLVNYTEVKKMAEIKLKNIIVVALVTGLAISWVIYLKSKNEIADKPNNQTITKTSEDKQKPADAYTKGTEGASESGILTLEAEQGYTLEKALSHGLPVLLNYGSATCQPCIEMKATLGEVIKEYGDTIVIKYIDVNKDPDALGGLPVKVVPTQFFFKADGTRFEPTQSDRQNGFATYESADPKKPGVTSHEGSMTKEYLVDVLKRMEAE